MSAYTGAEQIRRTGATLSRVSDREIALESDLTAADPLIILIHGFTAHGENLRNFGLQLEKWGKGEATLPKIVVLMFSYDSWEGIPHSARVLSERLALYYPKRGRPLREALNKKLFLIGHSMGGLVARQFAIYESSLVRGIVMLGTPNNGVPTGWLADRLITLAEKYDGPLPYLRKKSNVSRKQLTRKDARGAPLIDTLNNEWLHMPARPPSLSVSGGKSILEFGKSKFFNSGMNWTIQRLMSGQKNDGLVLEKSVDMYGSVFTTPAAQYSHLNGYIEYKDINHSYLIENTGLMRHVFNWMERH